MLSGIIEWRLDYPAATNQPPELGEVLHRSAFLVVKPVNSPPGRQRSYRWRIAQMGLLEEVPEHQFVPGHEIRHEPTDVTSWLWPSTGRYPNDAQWVNLDQYGATVGNPRQSSHGENIRDMVDPIWYEPVWGTHTSGETVSVDAFDRDVIEEHIRAKAPAPDTFFSSPKVERVRVIHNPELEIVEDITAFVGDEEVGWLRLSSLHQLI